MSYDENNIFAKILRGEIPNDTVYEDDAVLAFRDIAPQAPVHVLVIPKGAYVSLDDFTQKASAEEVGRFFKAVGEIARSLGLEQDGFRTIANAGLNGGQEVPHFPRPHLRRPAPRAHDRQGLIAAGPGRLARLSRLSVGADAAVGERFGDMPARHGLRTSPDPRSCAQP